MSMIRKFLRETDKGNNTSASASQAEDHNIGVDRQFDAVAGKNGDTNNEQGEQAIAALPDPDDVHDVLKEEDEDPEAAVSQTEDEIERAQLLGAWHTRPGDQASLPEVNSSVKVAPPGSPWYKNMWSYCGLGFIISVGYMDPGNWATDLAAGSAFGYKLLTVILMSNLLAIFYQSMALKLGVATERDLAQCCRDMYPRWAVYLLWIVAEVAIAATDLAEIIGSAVALNLLFGLPIWAGCLITFADVLFILIFGVKNFRFLELIVFLLCALIFACFAYQVGVLKPNWADIAKGLIPEPSILTHSDQLFVAIGILGATCMPHNIYLGGSIIQTRKYPRTIAGKRSAIRWGTLDVTLSLIMAFFVNAGILVTAAGAFHYGPNANYNVQYISQAYKLLATALGSHPAKILFAVGLLASGQNSTITGTLAGQIVMEGFLRISLPPWLRRLITRIVAMVPAAVVAAIFGSSGAGKLLVLSQVIISLTLTFATAPLIHFACLKRMGRYRACLLTRCFGIIVTLIVAGLNAYLVVSSIKDNTFSTTNAV